MKKKLALVYLIIAFIGFAMAAKVLCSIPGITENQLSYILIGFTVAVLFSVFTVLTIKDK